MSIKTDLDQLAMEARVVRFYVGEYSHLSDYNSLTEQQLRDALHSAESFRIQVADLAEKIIQLIG